MSRRAAHAAAQDDSDGLDPALAADALRLNDRFLAEVVERFGVCPFAERARSEGRVARWVSTQSILAAPEREALLTKISGWADDVRIEIGLVVFPAFADGPAAFDALVARLRGEFEARGANAFVTATFHPELPYSTESPARLMPFFRRSPDPTMQLVRSSVLERVRGEPAVQTLRFDLEGWRRLKDAASALSTSERIERANHGLLAAGALAEIETLYAELAQQRAARRSSGR